MLRNVIWRHVQFEISWKCCAGREPNDDQMTLSWPLKSLIIGPWNPSSLALGIPHPWPLESLILGPWNPSSLALEIPHPWPLKSLILGPWNPSSLDLGIPHPWTLVSCKIPKVFFLSTSDTTLFYSLVSPLSENHSRVFTPIFRGNSLSHHLCEAPKKFMTFTYIHFNKSFFIRSVWSSCLCDKTHFIKTHILK